MEDIHSWVECSLIYRKKLKLFRRLLEEHRTPAYVLQNTNCSPFYTLNAAVTAESIISVCENHGITIVTPESPLYPKCFYGTTPPIVFYLKGNSSLLCAEKTIGVIGSRRASPYSLDVCRSFTRKFANKGCGIVSGFALGVDSCAHISCMEAGGKTIAVLGSGIGCDYPEGSIYLQNKITAEGAVISEYPPFSNPVKGNFTQRNRLIAALCSKLLVIQAQERSGCLNTVFHALEQGKEIYVVPPRNIHSRWYRGQVQLIRDGAHIAFDPKDLL